MTPEEMCHRVYTLQSTVQPDVQLAIQRMGYKVIRTLCVYDIGKLHTVQRFDAVSWAAGRASGLKKN